MMIDELPEPIPAIVEKLTELTDEQLATVDRVIDAITSGQYQEVSSPEALDTVRQALEVRVCATHGDAHGLSWCDICGEPTTKVS